MTFSDNFCSCSVDNVTPDDSDESSLVWPRERSNPCNAKKSFLSEMGKDARWYGSPTLCSAGIEVLYVSDGIRHCESHAISSLREAHTVLSCFCIFPSWSSLILLSHPMLTRKPGEALQEGKQSSETTQKRAR